MRSNPTLVKAKWVTVPLRILVPADVTADVVADAVIDRWDRGARNGNLFLDSLTPDASSITTDSYTMVKW